MCRGFMDMSGGNIRISVEFLPTGKNSTLIRIPVIQVHRHLISSRTVIDYAHHFKSFSPENIDEILITRKKNGVARIYY